MEIKIIKPKVVIEAVVTRANGTVENLGVIADQTKEDKDNG